MPSGVGTAIVIAILLVIVFFATRATIRELKREVSGQGCAGCSGNCNGSCSASCRNCTEAQSLNQEKLKKIEEVRKRYERASAVSRTEKG